MSLRVGHQHSQFWPILAHFVDFYSLVGHEHSKFWPILARFVEYHSLFWGPEAISMVVEPQGALTCRSSTLIVLADSGPFQGLLLTVFGSGVISTIN